MEKGRRLRHVHRVGQHQLRIRRQVLGGPCGSLRGTRAEIAGQQDPLQGGPVQRVASHDIPFPRT